VVVANIIEKGCRPGVSSHIINLNLTVSLCFCKHMAQESVQGTIMNLYRPQRDFLSPVDAFNIRSKANGRRGSRTNLYDEAIPSRALSGYEILFHPSHPS
jgi:hypothetical protein